MPYTFDKDKKQPDKKTPFYEDKPKEETPPSVQPVTTPETPVKVPDGTVIISGAVQI